MPSFIEDIAAAVDAVGTDKVGLVWGIGMTDWASAQDRDQFLADISRAQGA
jgi:hypothetical protein